MIEWERCLHPSQREVFQDTHRFKSLACGTRWGKTILCAYMVLERAIKTKSDIWWVTPTYEIGERGIAGIYQIAPTELLLPMNKIRRILPMVTGSQIQFKTAENPVGLQPPGGGG